MVRHFPLSRCALFISFLCSAVTVFPALAETEVNSTFDTVVVTASGFEQEIKEAPASISVITQDDLEKKPFNNLGDALKTVEGIDVTRGGKAGGMNISIRGMPSDYTLILIDGKRLNQSGGAVRPNGFGDVDTNFIPPLSAIERIEVVRGPMSTLYGSDAMGGVINIITRKVSKEWSGSLKIDSTYQFNDEFGNNINNQIYLSGPLKEDLVGLSLRAGFFHRDRSIIEYQDKDGSIKKQTFNGLGKENNYNIGGRLTFTPHSNHDIALDVDSARQTFFNENGELGTLNSQVAAGRSGGGYKDELGFNRDRYSLSHTGRFEFGSSETSVLYDTTETTGRVNPVSRTPKPTDGSDRELTYDNITVDSKLTMPLLDDQHLLTVGGQYWYQELTDTLVENPQHYYDQYQWALFLEDEWRIIEPLSFTVGSRYDNNQKFGGNWSPRAYLVWNVTTNWTLKGGVSQGYKTPRINQMVDGIIGFGGQGTIPLLGNAGLTPEKSTTTEVSAIYDNTENVMTNLTLFQTQFKDRIESESIPNCLAPGAGANCINIGNWTDRYGNPIAEFSQPVNIGKARIRGLESGFRVKLADSWTLASNYTYVDSEQLTGSEQGRPLGSQPKHTINARVDWQITPSISTWLGTEYRRKQYRGVRPDGNSAYYSPYALVNLGSTYHATKNLSLNANIYNLLDKNFVNYETNPVNPAATSYSNSYYQVLEGRRLWVSANIKF